MQCPQCGQTMVKDGWIAGLPDNVIFLETLFWLLFLLVFLTGPYGFAAVTVALAAIIALRWGKARYSCPHCGHRVWTDG
jgi:predicted RNA-binding Zn-ribbon protein involved in translation (DUF1610 family)